MGPPFKFIALELLIIRFPTMYGAPSSTLMAFVQPKMVLLAM